MIQAKLIKLMKNKTRKSMTNYEFVISINSRKRIAINHPEAMLVAHFAIKW